MHIQNFGTIIQNSIPKLFLQMSAAIRSVSTQYPKILTKIGSNKMPKLTAEADNSDGCLDGDLDGNLDDDLGGNLDGDVDGFRPPGSPAAARLLAPWVTGN